jgi:co-chaperonin GroES (HSP10)
MIPVCPQNNIIVQIDKKYQDEIETESGIKLFKDTTFEPGWNATVTGKVVSVPHKVIEGTADKWHHRRGMIVPEVQVGDELAFSYMVVFDREMVKDHTKFYLHEDNGYQKEWRNCLDQRLVLTYLPDKMMVAAVLDKRNNVIQPGRTGTFSEVERWLTQNFKFTKGDDETVYANLMWLNEKEEYWSVDYVFAHAVRREGQIKMIGGYTLLEPLDADRMDFFGNSGKLIVPESMKKKKREGEARIVSIGTPLKGHPTLNVKPGDVVRFNERFVERYKFFGKDYLMLQQRRILAKVTK